MLPLSSFVNPLLNIETISNKPSSLIYQIDWVYFQKPPFLQVHIYFLIAFLITVRAIFGQICENIFTKGSSTICLCTKMEQCEQGPMIITEHDCQKYLTNVCFTLLHSGYNSWPPKDPICQSLTYCRLKNIQGAEPSKIAKLIKQHLP